MSDFNKSLKDQFMQAANKQKAKQRDTQESKFAYKCYCLLAPLFFENEHVVKGWAIEARKQEISLEQVIRLEAGMDGEGFPDIRVRYTARPNGVGITKDGLVKSDAWNYFKDLLTVSRFVVMPFKAKGSKDPWVMTNYQTSTSKGMVPRILITVDEDSEFISNTDIHIMPLSLYIKERT